MKKSSAFEVACGKCHVTRDVLQWHFQSVDLLDQCPQSVKIARELQASSKRVRNVFQNTMQDIVSGRAGAASLQYDCVVLRYCIGYLGEEQAVELLVKLARMLSTTTPS